MARIEVNDTSTIYDGGEAVQLLRLRIMVSGLRFEIRTGGMKLTRGPSVWTMARREFNLKGSREEVLAELERILAAAEADVPVVDNRV